MNFQTGVDAITHYHVEKKFFIQNKPYSLVRCKIETGRTHQIRVHFAYIGHPILGDDLYGIASPILERQALHACKISFIHPITKKELKVECSLSKDLLNIC